MNASSDHTGGAVRLEREGPLGWLVIDQPQKQNAVTMAMWGQMASRLAEAEADPAIRVIILRGAGDRAFSAGADISGFESVQTGSIRRDYGIAADAAFTALKACAKPTIGMILGFCLGGGLALALSCDLRVAAEGAVFGIPAAKLGLGYDPRWLASLLASVSPASAKELLFSGERFDTDSALRMGLLNRVFAPNKLDAGIRALAAGIAENAPLSILAAKRTIDAYTGALNAQTLRELDRLVEDCFASADYEEGRRAFQEKRKPSFQGR